MMTVLPGRSGADIDRMILLQEYWNHVQRYDWLSNEVWRIAVEDLIRTSRFLPTIAEVISACHEADREILRTRERLGGASGFIDDGMPKYLTVAEADSARPTGMARSIAIGEWDRAAATARARMTKRKEAAEAFRAAAMHDNAPLANRGKVFKRLIDDVVRAKMSEFQESVTNDDVDKMLHGMAANPFSRPGGLRGAIEDALRFRFPRGSELWVAD